MQTPPRLGPLALTLVLCTCLPVAHASGQIPLEGDSPIRFARQQSASLALLSPTPEFLRPRLSKIASILIDRCVGCHNSEQADGGYSMSNPLSMTAAGDSKRAPIAAQATPDNLAAIHSSDANYGEIFRRIVSHDATERMPKDAAPLDWESIESIRVWLATGATVDGDMDAPIESFVPWTVPSEPVYATYPRPHSVGAIAINNSGDLVFTSGHSEVLIWRLVPDPQLIQRIPSRGRFISDIAWNEHFQSVCVASGEPGRIGYVESIPWNPSSSSIQNRAYIDGAPSRSDSDPSTSQEAKIPSGRLTHWVCRDAPLDLALDRTGSRIAIGNADGSVVVADANSNHILWKSSAHAASVTSVDWSDDGKYVVSSSRDRTAKCFQADDGQVLNSFVDHERTVASIQPVQRGGVTMDEAGVLRWFPNLTSPGSRAQRGGFSQSTEKVVANGDIVVVPTQASLMRFRLRREEVVESKNEEGKEKKKTVFMIEETDGLNLKSLGLDERPVSLAISRGERDIVAAGFASGSFLVWNVGENSTLCSSNQPASIIALPR